MTSNPGDDQINSQECWDLLERVASSAQLKRAARLREVLFYVGTRSIKDGRAEVHEQEIGSVVFGRPEHYDTSQDNIVRVNATELRKRIETYFATEGANEALTFEIPRGSYTPVFRRRALPEPPAELSVPPIAVPHVVISQEEPLPPEPRTPHIQSRLPLLLVSAMAVVLAIVSVSLWIQNQAMRKVLYAWQSEPALTAFWPRFLNTHEETDIVLADTSFALIEDITKQPSSLSDYLNRSYLRQIQAPTLSADRKEDLDLIASRNNGSLGDFRVAQRILTLDPMSARLHLQFAREYTADQIKRNNVILVGSQKSNPWVDLFDNQMNFVVDYNPALNQSFIHNRNPKSGEQAVYAAPIDPYASVGYSVIAYLPNPSHTADALILAGTDSQATDAAGEFLTSEQSMANFQKKLHTKQFPYFEILLKTTHLSGTPFSAEVIAYRTH